MHKSYIHNTQTQTHTFDEYECWRNAVATWLTQYQLLTHCISAHTTTKQILTNKISACIRTNLFIDFFFYKPLFRSNNSRFSFHFNVDLIYSFFFRFPLAQSSHIWPGLAGSSDKSKAHLICRNHFSFRDTHFFCCFLSKFIQALATRPSGVPSIGFLLIAKSCIDAFHFSFTNRIIRGFSDAAPVSFIYIIYFLSAQSAPKTETDGHQKKKGIILNFEELQNNWEIT